MKEKGLKAIVVTNNIYSELKKRGMAGDSFNDVITRLLSTKEEEE